MLKTFYKKLLAEKIITMYNTNIGYFPIIAHQSSIFVERISALIKGPYGLVGKGSNSHLPFIFKLILNSYVL